MPGFEEQYLQQNSQLLAEIRDELRSQHHTLQASNGGNGSFGGMASMGGRPGHTFVAAQAAADRTLLGDWNTFGWSQAYKSTYQSTLIGDVGALIGFRRAPETLTQQEFTGIAGQSIAARVGNAALGFIAPEYNSRVNALADEIYQNSSRFIRFGNGDAGTMGTGFNFNVARSLSRGVQHEALNDLRLSGRDYDTITSLGMSSGQFDQVKDIDDFKSKVRELASATADLTRGLHMTAQEVATAMGNIRQMGVLNVGQQRNMMMQVGGAAMVAGMSSTEMLQFSGNIAQQGLQLGLSATTTMPAAANAMAMVRSLSQAGIISPSTIAMGGGAAGVAGQIINSEMQYAASQAGYLSLLGGGGAPGRNSFDAMLGGMGRAGLGTFEGAVTLGMDRIKNMANITPDQLDTNMRNMIESRLRMAGISDFTSRSAQGMGFQLARGMGMDDAAALTFAQSQFSREGRRAADLARIQSGQAAFSREQAVASDKFQLTQSFQGRFRAGLQNMEAGFASVTDAGAGLLDRMSGLNAGNKFVTDANNSISGATGGPLDAASISAAIDARSSNTDPTNPASLHIRNHDVHTMRALGWGAAAAGLTIALPIAAANAWNPVGWGMLGAIAIGTGVGLATAAAGSALGAYMNQDDETVITNTNDVRGMVATQRQILNANGSSKGARNNISNNTLRGKAWEELIGNLDRSKMNGEDLQRFSALVNRAAAENKTNGQDVIDTLRGVGAVIAPADMSEVATVGTSKDEEAAIKDLLGGQDAIGNIATSAGSHAAAKYLRARLSGTQVDAATLQAATAAFGGGAAFQKFQNQVSSDLSDGKNSVLAAGASAFDKYATTIGVAQFNRTLGSASNYARGLIDSAGLSDADKKAAQSELDSLSDKDNKKTLIDLLNTGKLHDLAIQGTLGQGVFKEAASVTDENLAGKSADDIATMYHINVKGLQDIMNDPTKKGRLREIVQASILGGQAEAQEQQAASPMLEATLLNKAATILDKLDQKLTSKDAK